MLPGCFWNIPTNEKRQCDVFWTSINVSIYFLYIGILSRWFKKKNRVPVEEKTRLHTRSCAFCSEMITVFPSVGFSHLDVMLVECYDPKGDQWNVLQTPILEGRSGPGCAVLDDSIYLVGGYSWSMVTTANIWQSGSRKTREIVLLNSQFWMLRKRWSVFHNSMHLF